MLLQLLGKAKNIPYGRDKPWVWERQHIVFQCSWCCDSVVSQSEFDYLLMWYPSTNCHELYIFCLLTRSIVGRNVDVLCLSHHFPVSSRHLLHSSKVSHWTSSECTRGRLRWGTLWGPVIIRILNIWFSHPYPNSVSTYLTVEILHMLHICQYLQRRGHFYSVVRAFSVGEAMLRYGLLTNTSRCF